MTILEIIIYWAIFGIIALVALNSEARKERKRWRKRYDMRRGNFKNRG